MYGSVRKSYLQTLDTIHDQGLRLALGAFRTSPISSLYAEANEPSLFLRREKLSLQYALRLAANPSNPAFNTTFSPQFTELYEYKPNVIKPFGLRILPLLESSNIDPRNIQKHFVTNIPSWCIKKPNILFDFNKNKKKAQSSPIILKEHFHVLQSCYSDYKNIYTDSSKDGETVGCACTSDSGYSSLRIPDGSSIFTAEATAINLAFDLIDSCRFHNKFIVFLDSLSVLKA